MRACVRNYCLKSEGKHRNQLKSSYCSSRLVKEGTGEVSWLMEGCYGVRDKIDKSNKSVLRVRESIEGRLCISTKVKVEKCNNGHFLAATCSSRRGSVSVYVRPCVRNAFVKSAQKQLPFL